MVSIDDAFGPVIVEKGMAFIRFDTFSVHLTPQNQVEIRLSWKGKEIYRTEPQTLRVGPSGALYMREIDARTPLHLFTNPT